MAQQSDLSASIIERVREVLEAAERAADEIRREVEAETQRRMVEQRVAAEEVARAYLEENRLRAEAFAGRRIERLRTLHTDIEERAADLLGHMDDALESRRHVEALLEKLADATDAVAEEAARPAPDSPAPDFPAREAPAQKGSDPETPEAAQEGSDPETRQSRSLRPWRVRPPNG